VFETVDGTRVETGDERHQRIEIVHLSEVLRCCIAKRSLSLYPLPPLFPPFPLE
jgi:hypothetical protein